MNTKLIIFIVYTASFLTTSSAIDPVADFKTNFTIEPGDKILKWQIDINGDGYNEIFLTLKSNHDKDKEDNDIPAWDVYLSDENGSNVIRSKGIQDPGDEPDSIGLGGLPCIDIESCFIGQITEISKRGIVTMRIKNPREGESIGEIYAYTIEGDHLKQTELAQYVIAEGHHPLFYKYLSDDKKTTITVTEIDP